MKDGRHAPKPATDKIERVTLVGISQWANAIAESNPHQDPRRLGDDHWRPEQHHIAGLGSSD